MEQKWIPVEERTRSWEGDSMEDRYLEGDSMETRYLYRAKRLDNGEWVQGYLSYPFCTEKGNESYYFYAKDSLGFFCRCVVDASTICQCTGLTDKNGKLIWENDIVFVSDADGCSGQMDTGVGKISFIEGLWYIEGRVQNGLYDIDKCFQIEVIGNTFDNPELLEV